MIAFQQAWRIHQIGAPNGVQHVVYGRAGGEQLRRVRRDLEFGFLAALHDHGGDTVKPVQPRLHLIRRHLPEPGLRHPVGGDAVTDDRKAGEGHAMRFDPRGVGKLGLHP